MEKYRFLDHTADIMVEAQGTDFPSALRQAALAMLEVMGARPGHAPAASFEISETGADERELTVNLLSAILAESEIREVLPRDVRIESCGDGRITARVSASDERPSDHIKAVTYHMLSVRHAPSGCTITVIFDV